MFRVCLFILFPSLCISSCTFFRENTTATGVEKSAEESTHEQDLLEAKVKDESPDTPSPEIIREEITAIEIGWRAPKTKVVRYILRYGNSPDSLDSEEALELEDLKVEEHPIYGTLYKYLLIGLPAKAVVYYTLQAENEIGLSEPTPVSKEEVR